MNTTGREIERKYVVGAIGSTTLREVDMLLFGRLFRMDRIPSQTSHDMYWKFPGADFIRLRENSKELTIKRTDKGSIEDREEENLIVESYEKGLRWAKSVFGEPVGKLEKTFVLYTHPTADLVISLYQVTGDPRVFLEIEADSIKAVDTLEQDLRRTLALSQQHQSLFQLMFGGSL